MMLMISTFDGGLVAAEPVTQESCDAANCSDAYAGHIVYAAIGEILSQQANYLPAINQCLQLSWCAQVLEKIATFLRALQAVHRFE